MPHRYLNARLAAKTSIRQVEATVATDQLGRLATEEVRRHWAKIVRAVRRGQSTKSSATQAYHALRQLHDGLVAFFMYRLERLARWSHQQSGRDLARSLPLDYLRAAAIDHLTTHPARRHLREAAEPGVIKFARAALGLATTDFAAPLREPETTDLSDSEQRDLFSKLLFPPLDEGQIAGIVFRPVHGLTWLDRLGNATRFATAEQIAPVLIQSYSLGRTQRQIAQDLLPLVDGVMSTARRIARTEGIRIANEAGELADDSLGSLVIGKQILAQLDQNTRPKHRARNGTVYYKRPAPGQLGYKDMPHPPIDEDGTVAWNCRCRLSVVLAPSRRILDNPQLMAVFRDAEHKAVADPITYAEWFQRADDKRRRLAVGSRKYAAMQAAMDRTEGPIAWEHFLDAKTAEPISLQRIKRETPEQRARRVEKVRQLIADRRRLLQQAGTFGFLLPT